MKDLVRMPAFWLLAMCLGVAAVYAPGFRTGFLSDDFMILGHLHEHGAGGGWTRSFLGATCVLFYRPLLTSSYALDLAVYGLNPWGFHFTNLCLHLACMVLVYHVGRGLTHNPVVGLAAAALHGFYPLGPNTVTWIAGRVSLLGCLFPLLAVHAFLAYRRRPGRVRAVTCVVALVGGLLSKESAMMVPLFVILVDLLLGGRRAGWGLHLSLWIVLAVFFVARRLILGVFLGGYGVLNPGDVPSFVENLNHLLTSVVAALTPFLETRPEQPISLIAWGVVAVWFACAVGWGIRGFHDLRGAILSFLWAGGMVLGLYGSWSLAPENAERWYPALAGSAMLLGVLLSGCGRPGLFLVVLGVVAGLPALRNGVQAYRETGARVRSLVSIVGAEDQDTGPLFVYDLPLTRRGAPFLHFGLADACAPPFARQRREVFPVHAPHTTLPFGLNPAVWRVARKGPVTVFRCNAEGHLQGRFTRRFLLEYKAFHSYRSLPSLPVEVTPRTWNPDLFVVSIGPARGSRVLISLFTTAGEVRLERSLSETGDLYENLSAAVRDFMVYPGNRRGFLMVVALDDAGKVTGIHSQWITVR